MPSLAISAVLAVLVLSCGQTHRHTCIAQRITDTDDCYTDDDDDDDDAAHSVGCALYEIQ